MSNEPRNSPLNWLAAGLLGVALWYGHSVLLLLAFALMVAIFLNRLSRTAQSHLPLSYSLCYFLVLAILLVMLGLFGWTAGSEVTAQTHELLRKLPGSAEELQQTLRSTRAGSYALQYLNSGEARGRLLAGRAFGLFSNTLSSLASFLLILLMGLYLAYEPELYRGGLVKLFPQNYRGRVTQVMRTIHDDLWQFLCGALTAMSVIAVLTTLALWALDIPMYLALGLLAGLLTFVPYLGPILSAVPALLVAFSVSPGKALWVLGCLAGIQLLESTLITPLVMRDLVRLPPALTLLSQSMFGVFFGIPGIALAAPATRVAMTLVNTLYLGDRTGDSKVKASDEP